jgi:hypothetical protein
MHCCTAALLSCPDADPPVADCALQFLLFELSAAVVDRRRTRLETGATQEQNTQQPVGIVSLLPASLGHFAYTFKFVFDGGPFDEASLWLPCKPHRTRNPGSQTLYRRKRLTTSCATFKVRWHALHRSSNFGFHYQHLPRSSSISCSMGCDTGQLNESKATPS